MEQGYVVEISQTFWNIRCRFIGFQTHIPKLQATEITREFGVLFLEYYADRIIFACSKRAIWNIPKSGHGNAMLLKFHDIFGIWFWNGIRGSKRQKKWIEEGFIDPLLPFFALARLILKEAIERL